MAEADDASTTRVKLSPAAALALLHGAAEAVATGTGAGRQA
jgi:hypothetical protein